MSKEIFFSFLFLVSEKEIFDSVQAIGRFNSFSLNALFLETMNIVFLSELFGDMSSDDDSDNELPGKKLGSDDDSPMGSPQRRENLSSPKSDDEEEKREETTIPVEIPKINTDLGENIHFVR